jgi:tRNA pseudouridine55 synthase
MIPQGVILIDKPTGISSFDVIRKVRKLTGLKRVGHAGTLDPEASGLLVVCLGSYTKLCGYLTESSKIYQAEIKFGIKTSTDDIEGEIISEQPTDSLSQENILSACAKFIGKIQQIPPRFSAVKINGQRAYKLARAEEEFSIAPREVEIFSLDIQNINLPSIEIKTHCSKGTYIRALARDIGDFLKVGAHAREIRRIASGSFDIAHAIKFADLNNENIIQQCLTGYKALGGLSNFELNQTDYERVKHGRSVSLSNNLSSKIAVAMFEERPVAIMEKNNIGNWEILRVM